MEDKEDEQFDKAVGQFQLNLNTIMNPLRLYGQGHYVDSATEEIVSLALQLHNRLSGVDEPYYINQNNLHY